jgi:hypothetical protein
MTHRQHRDEEQFWPVCLAMLTLCLFAIATITAYLKTEETRWYANSWTWFFAAIPLTCVVVGVLRTQVRWLRPSLQVSGILCLLVHAILFVACVETNIFGRFWDEVVALKQPLDDHEPLTEPDYRVYQTELQQEQHLEELRQPVASAAPDADRTISRSQQSHRLIQKPIVPETAVDQPELAPNLLERTELEQTVPKFSEQLTRMSRAEAARDPRQIPKVDIPDTEQQHVRQASAISIPLTRSRRSSPSSGPTGTDAPVPDAPRELYPRRMAGRGQRQSPDINLEHQFTLRRMTPSPSRTPERIETQSLEAEIAPSASLVSDRAAPVRRQSAPSTSSREAAAIESDRLSIGFVQSRGGEMTAANDRPQIRPSNSRARIRVKRAAPGQPTVPLRVDVAGNAADPRPAAAGSIPELVSRSTISGRANVARPRSDRGMSAANALAASAATVPARSPTRRATRSDLGTATSATRGLPTRRRETLGAFEFPTEVPLSSLPAATTGPAESETPPAESLTESDSFGLQAGAESGGPRKQDTRLHIDLPVVEGAGGLQGGIELDPGIPSRRASRESQQLQPRDTRFRRRRFSGPPAPRTSAVIALEPYRQRSDRILVGPQDSDEAGLKTERAIELGLAYLARNQLPDGSWSLRSADPSAMLSSDTAATGLALLTFQGAGYNHREHQYARVVAAGINYLKRHQQANGDLFVPLDDQSNASVWLYSHGIAALALTEAYGMTLDPRLQSHAQRCVDFIATSQDRKKGGWRYSPGVSSDTSVSGWMLMALKSAQLADLEVSEETMSLARRWFDSAQASSGVSHLYRYNPFAPDTSSQRHGRVPSPTMTAVGLLMRLYDGWDRKENVMVQGAEYLQNHLPARGTPSVPLRDTYYWYYGTQVMFHMKGEYWRQWRDALRLLVLDTQVTEGALAGSWDSGGVVPDRWAPHAGRLYVTTLNLLSLEVQYRHLPLYED